MIQNFEKDINNIKDITSSEKKLRGESLNFFNKVGFPNKRIEEWKFTDFKQILSDNFKKIETTIDFKKKK